MAIKFAVLLLCVAFISPLVTKNVKKEKTKEQDPVVISKTVPRKVHEWIRFDGKWYNCDAERNIDSQGMFCSCPFLACTGHPFCVGLYNCRISKRYTYFDIKKKQCECHIY